MLEYGVFFKETGLGQIISFVLLPRCMMPLLLQWLFLLRVTYTIFVSVAPTWVRFPWREPSTLFPPQVETLRRRQKPMSTKAAGRVAKYDRPVTRPMSPISTRRLRNQDSEFSPKIAKCKWERLVKYVSVEKLALFAIYVAVYTAG